MHAAGSHSIVEQAADETRRLRDCINDLIGILALPAVWNGYDPAQIVSTLLDVVVGILRLEFAFVRVGDPIGSGSIEMVRYDDGAYLKAAAQIIGEMLTDSFGANPGNGPGTQEARLETEVYRLSRSEPATTMKLTGS